MKAYREFWGKNMRKTLTLLTLVVSQGFVPAPVHCCPNVKHLLNINCQLTVHQHISMILSDWLEVWFYHHRHMTQPPPLPIDVRFK